MYIYIYTQRSARIDCDVCTRFSSDSDRVKRKKKKEKTFFNHHPMFTSWTLKIYTAHEPFQLSRVVIVRIQSNDTTRGLESTNRVAAAGTQGPHTSRRLVFPPLVCSPSPANNDRAYTRILNYTRGLDTVPLHERAPPIFPLVRRFRESDARTFVHAFSLTTWFICVFTHRWVAIASSVDHAKGKNDSFFKFSIHRCVDRCCRN